MLEIRSMLAADAWDVEVPTPEDDTPAAVFCDVDTDVDAVSDDGVDTAADPSDLPLVATTDHKAPDGADSGDGTGADSSDEGGRPIPDAGFDLPLLALRPVQEAIDPAGLITIDLGWTVGPTDETEGAWWPCIMIDPVGPTDFTPDANLPSDDDSQDEGASAGDLIDADDSGSSGDESDSEPDVVYPIPVDGGIDWSFDGAESQEATELGNADLVVPAAADGELAFFAAAGAATGDDQPSDVGSRDLGVAVTTNAGPQKNTANLFAAFATAFSQGGGDGQGSQPFASGPKRSARR